MAFYKLTAEQLQLLKREFEQLTSIEDKFHFWTHSIGTNYIWVGIEIGIGEEAVKDFLIYPNTPEETYVYNLLLLKQAKYYDSISPGKNINEFESLKINLDIQLQEGINSIPILEEEIEWVEGEVKRHKSKPRTNSIDANLFDLSLFTCWTQAYNDFYRKRVEPNFFSMPHNFASLVGTYSGSEVAKYRVYVEDKIKQVSKKQTPLGREETSMKRQLLILFYTGYIKYLEAGKSENERNKLLALILNRSMQNVKTVLTHINLPAKLTDTKSRENLEFVYNALTKAGLHKEAAEVRIELDALTQAK